MRASTYFLPTLREVPSDAEVASHRLLLRGGFIRKQAAGVYSYLPLGYRVHEKLSQIVREEMNSIGGLEFHLPVLVPRELLEETGRDAVDVLFPLTDRSERRFVLGFTHEEVITDIVRNTVSSWKQLPLILYQIQTKFRDEPRPRGGLLRGREFTMKDAYSFDHSEAGLDLAFNLHRDAYGRIFDRCGLGYLVVNADPGAIGGSESAEFMVLADSGEDTVLRCDTCGYAANAERAEVGYGLNGCDVTTGIAGEGPKKVATPGAHTVSQVCEFLGVRPDQLIKTIIVVCGGTPVAALVRGDQELQLLKLGRFLGGPAELADAATVETVTHAPVGFAGPVGLANIRIVADLELRSAVETVVGANEADTHLTGVTPGRDFEVNDWADIRLAVQGDRCGNVGCEGRYREAHGIEVGHIFKLGTKYSRDMKAQLQTETGDSIDIIMGCYGLGISRTIAAAIEAHHDTDGIIWPMSIAPFEVVIVLGNAKDDEQRTAADSLYAGLLACGVDVMYDDRDERIGPKFKDADLIGYPVRVVVGRGLAEGKVEVALRSDKAAKQDVPVEDAVKLISDLVSQGRRQQPVA